MEARDGGNILMCVGGEGAWPGTRHRAPKTKFTTHRHLSSSNTGHRPFVSLLRRWSSRSAGQKGEGDEHRNPCGASTAFYASSPRPNRVLGDILSSLSRPELVGLAEVAPSTVQSVPYKPGLSVLPPPRHRQCAVRMARRALNHLRRSTPQIRRWRPCLPDVHHGLFKSSIIIIRP